VWEKAREHFEGQKRQKTDRGIALERTIKGLKIQKGSNLYCVKSAVFVSRSRCTEANY